MLLRTVLLARVPLLGLRACCSAGPSTSNSLASHSSAKLVFFRHYSHVISADVARHFGASLVWVRGSGGGGKDWEEAEEVKGSRTRHSTGEDKGEGAEEPIKPVDKRPPPSKAKMFVVAALLSFAVTSLLFTTLIAESTVADSAIPADAPQVDFASFASKYLKAGEIQKITYVAGKDKAVGTLHPGAIIDGKPAKTGHVVINYPHPPQQFWADVRKEETSMGIALQQGVDIQMLNPVSGWRMLEFFIGCFILGWLFTQYGRLVMKRIAEQKARQAGKK